MNKIKNIIKKLAENPLGFYLLYFFPDNKRIDLNRDRGKTSTAFARFIRLIARYSKNKSRMIFRNVQFIDNQSRFKMNLNVNEYTQCGYYLGLYDRMLIDIIKQGGAVFIDIGANVGLCSLIASSYFNKVFAFEPSAVAFKLLKNNIEKSGIGNITALPVALSDISGSGKLHEFPLNLGGSSIDGITDEFKRSAEFQLILKRNYEIKAYPVELKTLDQVVAENRLEKIDLIKIDVEGHELNVLKGAMKTIAHFNPSLYIEIVSTNRFVEIMNLLPDYYKAFDPQTGSEIDSAFNLEPWRYSDIIFRPESTFAVFKSGILRHVRRRELDDVAVTR